MKIKLICIGKTDESYLKEGIEKYLKRLRFYSSIELILIPDVKSSKNLSQDLQRQKEGQNILKHIKNQDQLILLDENGKMFDSLGFSHFIQRKIDQGTNNCLVFVIGGPYGFHQDVIQRAQEKLSLSKLTFSHQMVRLFFVEQLYRAFTIMKGEPYHHS